MGSLIKILNHKNHQQINIIIGQQIAGTLGSGYLMSIKSKIIRASKKGEEQGL